jgi:crotonobetainyl-CoA:carnitine CoA-transferase CaiB-like acyl-CoA transferase
MTKVLQDIRVLELGTFITGPCAGMMLADLGADVIKIEQPVVGDPFRGYQGTQYSSQFQTFNSRKRSVALNLKSPQSIDILHKLLETADVLLENYRPGVMDNLGLNWNYLHEHFPRLVYCSITGFGATGPYVDKPCYDTVAQAMSGYLSQTMDPSEPRILGPAVADTVSEMYAAFGILGALVERGRTQKGRRVEVAMLDSMIAFGSSAFSSFFSDHKVQGPISRPSASQSYALKCSDGQWIALHLASVDKFFINLSNAIDHPEWLTDERFSTVLARQKNYELLTQLMQEAFGQSDLNHWLEQLTTHDIPHAPISSIDEVVTNPQVIHNGIFKELIHPILGVVNNTQRPILYDGDRSSNNLAPPMLGEHSHEVLSELGFEASAIDDLCRQGAVAFANTFPLKHKSINQAES